MYNKTVLAAALVAAVVSLPSAGTANDRLARVDIPALGAAKAEPREPARNSVVQDEVSKLKPTQDARIAEYIEMHGRATDWSGRASLMPWSALKQIAN